MFTSSLILAYFGPETVLPATSIIATVIGVVLMMGKNSLRWTFEAVKRGVGFCFRRGAAAEESEARGAVGDRSSRREAVEVR